MRKIERITGDDMLEFIIGRAGAGKSYKALKDIAERMKENPLGEPLLLLLPEHMTYKAERELLNMTGSGFFRAEVYGFRRFARSTLLKVGGLNMERISEVGRNLMLKNILRKNSDKLSFFAKAAKKKGFSQILSDAIQEVKTYRLTPKDLEEASGEVKDDVLSAKLKDLSLLSYEFEKSMEGRYNDNEDVLSELIMRLPEAKFLKGIEVWADGFIFFNPQEKEVLRALMKHAKAIHITLPMDPDLYSPENTREIGIFNRAFRTMKDLSKIAKEEDKKIVVTKLAGNNRAKTPALQAVETALFTRSNLVEKASDGVWLAETANKRTEAETVVADIIRLAREENYRYGDIGVLIRDEAYNSLLSHAFKDAGVPFFSDEKKSAAHHPLAELLRSSLEAIAGFSYEAILRALRTGFFNVPWDALDALENYVAAFNIKGEKRWRQEDDWNYRKGSLDFDDEASEREAKFLQEINFTRKTAIKPLLFLKDAMKDTKTVKERAKVLYEFLENENVTEKLSEWSKTEEAEGRLEAAELNSKVWKDVMSLFDQLVEVSGEEKMSLKAFTELLEEGLIALESSIIPPGLDGVTVASFNQNSLFNARAIYILGANAGVMPHYIRESGFFTDADRLKMKETGKEIATGTKDGNLAENYLLYRAFNEAREYLFVSYAISDGEGGALTPAPLVSKLKKILPDINKLYISLNSATEETNGEKLRREEKLKLPYPKKALSGLIAALRKKREGSIIEIWQADVYNYLSQNEELSDIKNIAISGLFKNGKTENLSEEITEKLFVKNGKLRGSVTQFESFKSCPFKHFAQFGLKLKEPETFDFHAFDLGSLLHSAFCAFGENLKKQNRSWGDLSEEEAEEILIKILEEIIPRLRGKILLSSAQYVHQKERIAELAKKSINRLIALDKISKFHPAMYETSFGGGKKNPLSYRLNKKITLEIMGQIDRLDFSNDGKYFLVIDYKTGQAAINLIDVYYGLRMQLLTYLLAAKNFMEKDKQKRIPAGVLYFFLKYPMLTKNSPMDKESVKAEIEKKLKMPGWILADEEIIKAIDESLHFLKIRLTKNGIHSGDKNSVKTEEEFEILMDYTDNLLKDTGKEILTGNINRAPYKLDNKIPCAYCPYDIFCDFDTRIEGFNYRELEDKSDEEIYTKMKEANINGMDRGTKTGDRNG